MHVRKWKIVYGAIRSASNGAVIQKRNRTHGSLRIKRWKNKYRNNDLFRFSAVPLWMVSSFGTHSSSSPVTLHCHCFFSFVSSITTKYWERSQGCKCTWPTKRWAFILKITLCACIVQWLERNEFDFLNNIIYGQRMIICAIFLCLSEFLLSGSRFLSD